MQQQPAGSTKIRVDFSDSTGAKYSVNIENPSKDNVAKLLDFVDSIAPLSDRISPPEAPIDTNFGRVYGLLETKFKF
ncbi:MAG: hypothetical protein ACRECH_15820, partial [Nitrososphaerales archaeon]